MKDKWTFGYSAKDVLAGANRKMQWHQFRLEWWTKTRAKVLAEIKEKGLTIDESVAEMISNSYAGRGDGVMVNNKLSADLRECSGKVREHRDKVNGYAAWVQVLSSQGHVKLELDQQDWMYFFSTNDPEQEAELAAAAKLAA